MGGLRRLTPKEGEDDGRHEPRRILAGTIHEERAAPDSRETRDIAVREERPAQAVLGRAVERIGLAGRHVLRAVAEAPVVFVARAAHCAALSTQLAKRPDEIE